jgi:hypothetical protein
MIGICKRFFIPFPISGFMCARIENNIIMLPMRHLEKRFTNTDMKASRTHVIYHRMQAKISQRMQVKFVNRQSGTGVNKKAFPNTCNLSEMQTHVIYQKMQINIVNRQD